MDKRLRKIYEKAILSGGEKYLPVDEMEEYINTCTSLGIAIIAVDFFNIRETSIQPIEELTGFDASTLFDETLERIQNIKNCNSFILSCYQKSKDKIKGFYFTSVIEYATLEE